MSAYTPYHSLYLARRITLQGVSDDAFAKSLSTARVDMNPHQVDAALFALHSPLSKGVILADEVGLGKTIEASLVIAQRWAERKRRILLIVPASLRKQWTQELWEKFSLPSLIMEAKTYRERVKTGHRSPFDADGVVVVTSYEFAALKADELAVAKWDLVIFDEAHRLRNVYRKGASARAKRLRDTLRDPFKVLLTATPLQNNIMELFGLVSIIDDKVFGDEASFRTLYGGARPDRGQLMVLRKRMEPICRRTLRKNVQEAGHINYTRRIPVTFRFDPHPKEIELYERVSAFLQRPDTVYLGGKPNALVTMSLRKILGSSSHAISETLARIAERLRAQQEADLDALADLDTIDELVEEWGDLDDNAFGDEDADGVAVRPDPQKLAAEIEELLGYYNLARSIQSNAKGERLIAELPVLLDAVVEKGGRRKAVIFTESVRTQTYLAELLAANGFARQIALLNGANTDRESATIYAEWLARYKGSDKVSGSKTADMKAAIVEAFRDEKTILIATESGAEGINLQFCSLLVNYDLPWNPQRVEQRIGRCHRYGQKIDVTVVNLLNTKNRAEERVFELLDQKFRLFDGVFGASDEVLGAIESGVDFERRVHEIVQTARTADEIDAAFNELTGSLQPQIEADMREAREKLLLNVDEDVVRLLRTRKDSIDRTLSEFEQRLLVLAKSELPEARFWRHENGSPCFEHGGNTWTTEWPLADDKGWQFFRLSDGNLALDLVQRAQARDLPISNVEFRYDAYRSDGGGRLIDLEAFIGASGWLKVSKLSLRAAGQTIEHVISAAITDDGRTLDGKLIDRLFLLPGATTGVAGAAPVELETVESQVRAARIDEAARENERWLSEETEKLDRYADDLEVAAEEEIKQLEREVKERRKALRTNPNLTAQQKIEEQRAIKKLEGLIDDQKLETYQRRKAIRSEVEGILDSTQADLELVPTVEPVFTIRWSLVA
ncbi:SNF2-related protein [Roseomonas genomospecies 6]|uniref:Helicase SNF2 n=1 Tax=Roseomonas genomospecies 6 TaxID=214106 RepID=A0A9W7KNM0_9PROT|nr:SNF2-related protein [Roseomonas genomospecies 6]KAA0676358.1 helicase SNF2 [Roseomonas genomospecies 6]